jgi:A/G-specific adenine glycosylase
MPVESDILQYAKSNDNSVVAQRLLAHYDGHARMLPWRIPPGSGLRADPYRVWLSEVMLQQTTVAAVIPYYESFIARWPTVEALARADDADVMAAWAGLGYYARARNLIACARAVTNEHAGRFPDTEEGLRALPGLGAYTAAAVAAIVFGRRAVVVDANVERVVARLFVIDEPLPGGRAAIRAAADSITPETRAGDFAQAMMDLGAGICTSRAPRCLLCPLQDECEGRATGRPEDFPVKAAKREKPQRLGNVWWIERADGHVWIERRAEKRMLGGMVGLPGSAWDARGGAKDAAAPISGDWVTLNRSVEHVFTHFRLTLTILKQEVPVGVQPPGEGQYWPLGRIGEAGLPTLFAKVVRAVMRDDDD